MYAIADIVNALQQRWPLWQTLDDIEVVRRNGEVDYTVGNFSVVARVRHKGFDKILKCYTRQKPYLKEIYGSQFLPGELIITDVMGFTHSVDCLLVDYIAGETLDKRLLDEACNIEALSQAFERVAVELLAQIRAHGDIKPDNIIVTEDGELYLVDWDACFVKHLAGKESAELGSSAYQHPARSTMHFNRHIDDYSIAYLLTMLRAAQIDRTILEHFRSFYAFAPSPAEIVASEGGAIAQLTEQFAQQGMAKEYRLSKMLSSHTPYLYALTSVLTPTIAPDKAPFEVEQLNGYWGVVASKGWVVGPLYDWILEPFGDIYIAGIGDYVCINSLRYGHLHTLAKGSRIVQPESEGCIVQQTSGEESYIKYSDLLHNFAK